MESSVVIVDNPVFSRYKICPAPRLPASRLYKYGFSLLYTALALLTLPGSALSQTAPETAVSDTAGGGVVYKNTATDSIDNTEAIAADSVEIVTADSAAAPDSGAAVVREEPESKPNIAVYVTGDVPDNEKKALGTYILDALVNSGRYNAIERTGSFLAEIDKEQTAQRSGAIDDRQISKVGRQFGVKFVCIADITPALGAFQVSARIVNVETAEVAFIGQAPSPLKTIDDLANVSNKVVRRMFGLPDPTETDSLFRRPRIEISVGAGGLIGGGFGGGITWPGGERVKMPYTATGVYLFFDAVYAELFFGYSNGNGKWESPNAPDPKDLPYMPRSCINAGLFAKYPFEYYGRVKLFPLLGLDYIASISGKLKLANKKEYTLDGANGRPEANALSSLWFKVGGGIDFGMGKTVYLRSELIYGLRGANAFEKFCADNTPSNAIADIGHGLDFKIGAGAKF